MPDDMTNQESLIRNTLQETRQYTANLAVACPVLGKCFQTGKQQNAFQPLKDLLEGVGWITEAFRLTRPFQQKHQIHIDTSTLPALLEELVAALEAKDHGLVADLLEFEIRPLFESWTRELEKLEEQAG